MSGQRRRLLVISAPVAVVVLLVVVKLWSVVIAGGSAASDFADRDSGALRADVDTLNVLDVIEPAKTHVAAGSLAVLEDRLTDADGQFTEALARTDPAHSCPIRTDLEFIRETMGDRAAAAFDGASAASWYQRALAVVESAPEGCFGGSTDADEQRRAVLDDAEARLDGEAGRAARRPATATASSARLTAATSASTAVVVVEHHPYRRGRAAATQPGYG